MTAEVKQVVERLERHARGNPGIMNVSQVCSLPSINQLGMGRTRQRSQRNSLAADPGMGGSDAVGWITPPTPTGGFASFRALLAAVQRVNPGLSYPDCYRHARLLVRPGIFSGKLDGASLTKEFASLEPTSATR